jgi:hypothetical protein
MRLRNFKFLIKKNKLQGMINNEEIAIATQRTFYQNTR